MLLVLHNRLVLEAWGWPMFRYVEPDLFGICRDPTRWPVTDTIRILRFLKILQPPAPMVPSLSYLLHPDSSTGFPCSTIEVLGLWLITPSGEEPRV